MTPPVVMLIRHGEKPSDPRSHVLSSAGRKRAEALADLFCADPMRQGLYRPDRLIVSEGGTASLRPWQTLAPLAHRLGEPEIHSYAASDYRKLAKRFPSYSGVTLVCFEHTALVELVRAVKHVSPHPPKHWPGSRYDVVWTLQGQPDGAWAFSQRPQLLMPGDKHSVI